jgi:L-asparagine transporter-like permease
MARNGLLNFYFYLRSESKSSVPFFPWTTLMAFVHLAPVNVNTLCDEEVQYITVSIPMGNSAIIFISLITRRHVASQARARVR